MSQTTTSTSKLLLDSLVGAGLLVALMGAFAIDLILPSPPPSGSAGSSEPKVTIGERDVPVEPEPQKLRLAVTTPHYDDMGKLLNGLGNGFQHDVVRWEDLLDPRTFDKYDVLFYTCSANLPDDWVAGDAGGSNREGTRSVKIRPEIKDRLKANLRAFLNRGGTLYASDLIFGWIQESVTEFVRSEGILQGAKQKLVATTADPGLANQIGSEIELSFDQAGWIPAAFGGQEVQVLLRGKFRTVSDTELEAPLLVKFPVGQGTMIFSSFHNEHQNSEIELKLLRYLVFSSVLAKTEAKVTETLVQGGFSPRSKNMLSTTTADPSVTNVHRATKAGPIKFALGFAEGGARLKLTVVGPDGKPIEKEGTSSFSIDVVADGPGDWKWTITSIKTPFENFPFNLTIGEKGTTTP